MVNNLSEKRYHTQNPLFTNTGKYCIISVVCIFMGIPFMNTPTTSCKGMIYLKLPKDVALSFLLRRAYIVLCPVMWYAFFGYVVFEYVISGKYTFEYTDYLAYPVAFFILTFPFFKGWIKRLFSDKSFVGAITEMKKRRVDEFTGATKTRQRKTSFFIDFKITDKSGKNFLFSVEEPSFHDTDYYKIGDLVRHTKGSKQLEKVLKSGDDDVICLVCGDLCRMQHSICFSCRHTLVKRSGIYIDK